MTTGPGRGTPRSGAAQADLPLPGNPRVIARSGQLGWAAVLLSAAFGLVVLGPGWALGLAPLRTVLPGYGPVMPLSALGLLLLGLALGCAAPGPPRRWRQAGAVAAGVAVAIGVVTLAEYATGIDLPLDRLLFPDAVGALATPHPGRVTLGSAICFVLLGVALLSLFSGSPRAVVVSQLLGGVAALTGLITLDNLLHSYAQDAQPGAAYWLTPVSALGITLLALGILVARPRLGLLRAMTSASVSGVLGRRMLLAAVTVPFLLGWAPLLPEGLGIVGARLETLLIITATVAIFGAVSFIATGAAARLEGESIRANQEAREGHAQLLALIDNTSAVIYIRDLDGRYLLVNREYERLFEVKRDEIMGLTDHDLFPVEMADDFLANDKRALAADAPILMEEEAPQDDGVHTYITVKFPLTDAGGRTYGVCGISTDITDRKRAEEEVRLLNSELELRVRQRTEELEASARELDAFAYSVSHDLRAPLRSVDGFSQILLEDYTDRIDGTGQDYLRRLRASTQRMGRLIDDLLELSRTTRTELRREQVDLSELARATTAELRAADPDRDVTVVIADGLVAPGDRRLLGLAVQNLFSNAWKFTAKRPDARIEMESVWQDGQLQFRVSDNGAGFDMRYVDKLFGPFQRLHTVAEFEGTGIGLATVRRIIRRHGGEVRGEGAPGRGATFFFTLPSRGPAGPSTALDAVTLADPPAVNPEPAPRLEHSR
jgi:PAS domain S-box-containing protein